MTRGKNRLDVVCVAFFLCIAAISGADEVEWVAIHSPIVTSLDLDTNYKLTTPKEITFPVPAWKPPVKKATTPTSAPTPVPITSAEIDMLAGTGKLPSTPRPVEAEATPAQTLATTAVPEKKPVGLPSWAQARDGAGRYNITMNYGEDLAEKLKGLESALPGQRCWVLFTDVYSRNNSVHLCQCEAIDEVPLAPLPKGVTDADNGRYYIHSEDRNTFERLLGELEATRPPGLVCRTEQHYKSNTLIWCRARTWPTKPRICASSELEDFRQAPGTAPLNTSHASTYHN